MAVWLAIFMSVGTVTMPDAWAATLYVDNQNGSATDGSNNCQNATIPCKTITHALALPPNPGDVVIVNPNGTSGEIYNANETFPLPILSGVTVQGDDGTLANAPLTTVESNGTTVFSAVVTTSAPLASNTTISGLTITSNAAALALGLIKFSMSSSTASPLIENNIFQGNATTLNGVGVYIYDASTNSATFTGNITGNILNDLYVGTWVYANEGGAGDNFSPTVSNNTFASNQYPITFSAFSDAEGTMAPNVTNNITRHSEYNDLYLKAEPGTGSFNFSPTVANNTFGGNSTSGAGYNAAYIYLSAEKSLGNTTAATATFNVELANNTINSPGHAATSNQDAAGIFVDEFAYQKNSDGAANMTVTIQNNTVAGAKKDGILVYSDSVATAPSAGPTTVTNTISDNTVTGSGGNAIYLYQSSANDSARENRTSLIAGNNVSGNRQGIGASLDDIKSITSGNDTVMINNNTINGGNSVQDGISMSVSTLDGGNETALAEINGNNISNETSAGIYFELHNPQSPGSFSGLIEGNTVTGASKSGMAISVTSASLLPSNSKVTVADNVLSSNLGDGIDYLSRQKSETTTLFDFECNTITNNGGNGTVITQAKGRQSNLPDFGGGNASSPGMNIFTGNGNGTDIHDFVNDGNVTVSARNDYWGTTNTATIGGHILRNPGNVDFGASGGSGPLAAAPTATYTALLSGPSSAPYSSTITYTVTVTANGACGQAAVIFTEAIPANETLVPGSITTTQGTIIDPVTSFSVNLGHMAAGDVATITWQVVLTSSTSVPSVSANAQVTSSPGGNSTTNNVITTLTGNSTTNAAGVPVITPVGAVAVVLLLALIGFALLRRGMGGMMILILAASVFAFSARANAASPGHVRPVTSRAAVVSTVARQGETLHLILAGGEEVTLPAGNVVVEDQRPGHQPHPQMVHQHQGPQPPPAPETVIPEGSPIVIRTFARHDGTVRKVKVIIFSTLAEAQRAARPDRPKR